MLKFCLILLFCVAVVRVDAWVSMAMSEPNTEHLGDCYTKAHKLGAMNKGETRRIEGQCAEAHCGKDRYLQFMGCGTVAAEPPCKVVDGDLSKPYPKCCNEVKCP